MAEDKRDVNATPDPSQQSKDGGEKLILGKYKTWEEGEKAIHEAQRRMHEATEEASKWKRVAQETLEAGRTDDGGQNVDSGQFTEQFLSNPLPVLDEWSKRITSGVMKHVGDLLDRRDSVAAFIETNPEIKENPRLFMAHVAQTDPSERDYLARLRKAHESYKTDLEAIKQRGREENDAAHQFQDKQRKKAASSPDKDGDQPIRKRRELTEEDDEGSFNEYFKEREAARAKMLTPQI